MLTVNRFQKDFFNEREGAALVLSPANRFYLTGFESSDGIVLITGSSAHLIVDFRYYEVAKQCVKGFDVVLADKSLLAVAKEVCAFLNVNTVYIEDEYITVSLHEKINKLFDGITIDKLGNYIEKMRTVKTEQEIEKIKNAQILTDAAFEHIINFIRPGLTENDVALELDFFMRKNGAQEMAFKTIAVSGKKSSLPHGEPSGIVLSNNSFLTMDFGARLDGYCSDMTRTVVLGKADSEMKSIYNTVLEAQQSALKAIRTGVNGNTVDKAARDIIKEAGYGNNFGHSTGHGLGIEVHESPSFSPNYDMAIPCNAVLSVEPGIYIEEKYGVRIEDIVVIKENSALNLTRSTKNLIEI